MFVKVLDLKKSLYSASSRLETFDPIGIPLQKFNRKKSKINLL